MTGSLRDLMDQIEALERAVSDEVRVYRWRPSGSLQAPAIYNHLLPNRTDVTDPCRVRDEIHLAVRLAVSNTDPEQHMGQLENYADLFRATFDPVLQGHGRPFGLTTARRIAMGTVLDEFNQVPYIAIEFRLELWLDHYLDA